MPVHGQLHRLILFSEEMPDKLQKSWVFWTCSLKLWGALSPNPSLSFAEALAVTPTPSSCCHTNCPTLPLHHQSLQSYQLTKTPGMLFPGLRILGSSWGEGRQAALPYPSILLRVPAANATSQPQKCKLIRPAPKILEFLLEHVATLVVERHLQIPQY